MDAKAQKKEILTSQRGMALVETLPLLFIFLLLLGYGVGFFGIVHTSTLNTIAARTYAFETFRNKTNLVYFRTTTNHFNDMGLRIHGIASEISVEDTSPATINGWPATTRPLAIGVNPAENARDDVDMHNTRVFEIRDGIRNTGVSVSPVWVMTSYGICLTYDCGDGT